MTQRELLENFLDWLTGEEDINACFEDQERTVNNYEKWLQGRNSRRLALNWWNNLDIVERERYYNELVSGGHFTPATDYRALTGREIQIIYQEIYKVS